MVYRSQEVPLNLFNRLDDNTKNLEDCTIIWLDRNTSHYCYRRSKSLRSIVNYLKIFANVDDCVGYISSATSRSEHMFVIVSGQLGQYFVPLVHTLAHVNSIYIFCFNKEKHRIWTEKYVKVRGVFTDEHLLYEKLDNDVNLCLSQIPINIIIQEKTSHSLQEKGTFLWSQLLLEVLLHLPPSEKAQQDMLQQSYIQYQDNSKELDRIDEFKRTYSADDAVRWYTLDSFVYRLVNKALRTEDIDQIFAYRFFISDLHRQLKHLHSEYVKNLTSAITVYRGQLMSTIELNKIKSNINEYISINTFFSTSASSDVATNFFAGATLQRPIAEWVLMEITIDPQVLAEKPFAAIHQWSVNKDENEILFSMGTVFQIESCEEFNENFWLITLKLSVEQDENIKQLFTYYKNQIGESSSLMILGEFLHKLHQFDKAERYYHLLFNELPEDYYADRGMALNNIATIYTDRGKVNEALKYLHKALDIYSKNLPTKHLNVAEVFSNLASVYSLIDKHTLALKYQHKALRIQKKLLPDNDLALATTYNNMADMYNDLHKHKKALLYFRKTLQIELEKLPTNHPDLAITYNNMGNTHTLLDEYSEANKCLQKALSIRVIVLPPNHSDLADTYRAIGSLNVDMGNTTDALENYYKALNIHLASKLDLNHERLAQIHTDIGLLLANHDYQIAATKHCKQALYHSRQQDNPNIYTMANVYNRLIESYIDKHKYKTAMKQCHQALKLQRECQQPGDTVFLITHCNLADIYYYQKKHNKALHLYQYVADCYHHTLPVEQHNLAEVYKNIAYVYREKKYINKSLFYFKKALRLRLEHDARNYNDLGLIYHEIGRLYEKEKTNNQRAIWYYKRALCHYLKANVTKITSLAQVYLSLGNILYETNDFIRAKRYLIKARNSAQTSDNKEELTLAQAYFLLGCMNRNMNQFAKARKNFKHALNIFMKQNNRNTSVSEMIDKHLIVRLYNRIGESFLSESNLSNAMLYLKSALHFASSSANDNIDEEARVQIEIATTHLHIGFIYKERKKFGIAGKHFKRSFTILNRYPEGDHFCLGLTCLYTGAIWKAKENDTKALPFLKRAQRLLLRSTAKHKDSALSETYLLLGLCYHYQENLLEAQHCYERARDLRIQSSSIEYDAVIDDAIRSNLQQLQQSSEHTSQNATDSI